MVKLPFIAPVLVLVVAALPALIALPSLPISLTGVSIGLGWLGSGLLSASLLLTINDPRFANAFGEFGRLYRWHHALGTFGYIALLVHPLALAAPFLPSDPALAWQTLSPSAQDAAGILGWLALLGLMAGLAGTFAIRLSYRLWRRLHAALAAVVVLGIVHVVVSGGFTLSVLLVIAPTAAPAAWHMLRAVRDRRAQPTRVPSEPPPNPAAGWTTVQRLFVASTAIFWLAFAALWFCAARF